MNDRVFLLKRHSDLKTIYNIITRQPLFQGMKEEQLRWLAGKATQTWFEADELIFRDGDVANRFYLLVNGEAALELPTNGRTLLLQTIGPGEPLGWPWLFSSLVSAVRARAIEPTEVVFFYGSHLRERCEKNLNFGRELSQRVAEVTMQRLQATRRLLWAQHDRSAVAGCDSQPGQR